MFTGNILRDAVISGANNISNQRNSVDELNVFPVPDGDTGTNMSMTVANAAKEVAKAFRLSCGRGCSNRCFRTFARCAR